MALLNLLRRFRPNEEDEDEEQAEDAGKESEDEDDYAGGGLLARLTRAPGLGRLLNRGDDDDDDDEDEDAGEGGILSRFNILRRFRRGGRGDDDDDEVDEPAPLPAGAAPPLEPAAADMETSLPGGGIDASETADDRPQVPGEIEDPTGASGPLPMPADAVPDDSEDNPDLLVEEPAPGLPTVALRLRELAHSQEDVPAEQLAGELRDLLSRFEQSR